MIFAAKWRVERRADGVVLVRVPSNGTYGRELPDAVVTFRAGDPQYDYWQKQLCAAEVEVAADSHGATGAAE